MDIAYVERITDKFNNITKKPEKFLSAPEKLIGNIKECLKETYDFIKTSETPKTLNTLPALIVENFDVEQIWQQIELQNNDILTKHLKSVGRLVAQKENLWLVNDDNNENISDSDGESNNDDKNNETFDDNHEEDKDNETNIIEEKQTNIEEKTTKKHSKKSSVDDDFFKLDEMEKFLNREEQLPKSKTHGNDSDDDDDDEESVDLFDMKSDDELEEDKEETSDVENNPKYDEFFGDAGEASDTENNKRKRTTDKSSDDDDEDGASENEYLKIKSSLELKNERLHRKIEDIEEQALQDKSWQYKGEVTADKRPQNSLLEEIVDFDMTVRPAPVITEETTYKLEDVIKKRIKDKVWDDVERKTKLVDSFIEYKKKLILDQEKSKKSLAQIYEDEYLKQKEAVNPDASEKPDEEPKEQIEIKSLMKNLFAKLDALSNFHFTPKSVAPELRVVNNLPAINMEEVIPVASSDASLLAPEDIKKKTKGEIIGRTERTKTDKKRERRQKKLKQQEHAKNIKNKEKATQKKAGGLGMKYDKQKAGHLLDKITKDSNVNKMKESGIEAKSSTAFFTQLQDEVRGQIKKKTTHAQKNKNKPTHIAKKLKL